MVRDYPPGEKLFQERSQFIRENYPGGKQAHDRIIRESLEGFDVMEQRDQAGNLQGILTYSYGKNREGKYCAVGVILVDDEMRGTNLAADLAKQLMGEAKTQGCTHMTAIADTPEGAKFLERLGFEEVYDKVNKRDYFRFDLE